MSLKTIFDLLKVEYKLSRHLFWVDEVSGQVRNDVTDTLHRIVQAAQGLRRGDESEWESLIRYCIGRSMSPDLLIAIDVYLRPCGDFPPLPLLNLKPKPYRSWQPSSMPLLDETDVCHINSKMSHPEKRDLALKHRYKWSRHKPRMTDLHPDPKYQTTRQRVHWLF